MPAPQEMCTKDDVRSTTMERDFEVVLHIGYPKTASTWLQETVFRNPALGFVVPWDRDEFLGRATAAFVTVNSFDDDVAKARSFFEEGLRSLDGQPGVPIVSDESLCGDPTRRINNYAGRYIADRLRAAFPSARILIGIREQKAIALSLYREYLHGSGGVFPLEVFLGRGDEPPGYTPILYPDYLEYDRIVGYYQRLYGQENVHVLPMEWLRRDPAGYVRSILEFCRCPADVGHLSKPVHVGQSALALTVRRPLNRVFPPNPLSPHRGYGTRAVAKVARVIDRLAPKSWSVPIERRWKDAIARRFNGRFIESNRRLAEQTGLDLASMGYEL
jgi:hypothetical protein